MNKLSTAKRAQIVGMMSEGNSLRAITRMTGASINTVTKLLVDLGTACAKYHDEQVPTRHKCFRNVACRIGFVGP